MAEPHYVDASVTLYHGDALDVLRSLDADSLDAVCTDPPYGLEFMGREWDRFKPSAARLRTRVDGRTNPSGGKSTTTTPEAYVAGVPYEQWCEAWAREVLRVLKPGAHLLAFGGTRTVHRLTCGIEDAGFEIRDGIDWIYGSGFPKSLNLGDGRGTALKPAREPIVLARKPLAGTVAANVQAYGTGALNIDGCRVPATSENARADKGRGLGYMGAAAERGAWDGAAGRWPANVALSHCGDEVYGDLCADRCVEGCPVAELDAQSGSNCGSFLPAGRLYDGKDKTRDIYGKFDHTRTFSHGDSGGASRFFARFRYEAKAPAAERPRVKMAGESGRVAGPPARCGRRCNICGNQTVPAGGKPWPACGHDDWTAFETEQRAGEVVAHPTVKPLALMRWLVRLVTPPGGTVLDPFAGSGTTGEACVVEGFRAVLVEREADYLPLIVARLSKPLQPVLNLEEMS